MPPRTWANGTADNVETPTVGQCAKPTASIITRVQSAALRLPMMDALDAQASPTANNRSAISCPTASIARTPVGPDRF
jgi:hypothetical protein